MNLILKDINENEVGLMGENDRHLGYYSP